MIVNPRQSLAALLVLSLWASLGWPDTAVPAAPRRWPNDFVARLEASLLLQTLNADLLSHDSATLTLERWCADHRLAEVPRIVAERILGADKVPTEEQRRELRVSTTDVIRYRRVRLLCGNLVLSEADNWYVPGRLTADMNKRLETTDIPFGRVVQALRFQRHTLSARVLWPLLPQGWEMRPPNEEGSIGELTIPAKVLEHTAVLNLSDGTPFSEVVETYTGNVLAISIQPWRRHCPP